MGQAGRPTSRYHLLYLLSPALPYLGLLCLSLSILFREIICQEAIESIHRAMRRYQTRAPEPMRSTLPNTDQPRIPHSEYHYNWRRRQDTPQKQNARGGKNTPFFSPENTSNLFFACGENVAQQKTKTR